MKGPPPTHMHACSWGQWKPLQTKVICSNHKNVRHDTDLAHTVIAFMDVWYVGVHTYVCTVYVCIHIRMHIYSTYIHTYICLYVLKYCMYIQPNEHLSICMYVCVHVCIHTYVYVYIDVNNVFDKPWG